MNFILDSSLTLSFLFADEATAATDAILDVLGGGAKAFVPSLWRWEVANALYQAERRKRITGPETGAHLTSLRALPIHADENAFTEAWNAALLLARKHSIMVYDATYLELALRTGLPLGSLDDALRNAAKRENMTLLPEHI